jgi:hypothetical protein
MAECHCTWNVNDPCPLHNSEGKRIMKKWKFLGPYATIQKIEEVAIQHGVGHLWDAEIVPLLPSMVKMIITSEAQHHEVDYEIDWAPLDRLVEERKPLDARTLDAVQRQIDQARHKASRDAEKYGFVEEKTVYELLDFMEGIVRQLRERA